MSNNLNSKRQNPMPNPDIQLLRLQRPVTQTLETVRCTIVIDRIFHSWHSSLIIAVAVSTVSSAGHGLIPQTRQQFALSKPSQFQSVIDYVKETHPTHGSLACCTAWFCKFPSGMKSRCHQLKLTSNKSTSPSLQLTSTLVL